MSSYKIIENSKVPNYNKVYTVGVLFKAGYLSFTTTKGVESRMGTR